MNVVSARRDVAPMKRGEISARVRNCPRLPSLRSIESALRELLNADNRYTGQISDVIRRDPSLTARLLRLVNSVYYGLGSQVNGIEEAVFYLGMRQIRQLVVVTPVIEDFTKLAGPTPFAWRQFWQHCIATAMLTREVVGAVMRLEDDMDYVGGLVHDVGKIVMASAFPRHFNLIYVERAGEPDLLEMEQSILGIDHAELGAIYLEQHQLPEELIEVVRHHHQPELNPKAPELTAAVHLADQLARFAGIGNSGNKAEVADHSWFSTPAWRILHPDDTEEERLATQEQVQRTLERLPAILEELV